MASSYTGLGTELMTTGENAGNWGTKTNVNLQIIEQMVGGYTEQDIAGSADTTTLSVSDGSTGAVLSHRIIKFTGTITGNQIVTIPLDVQQMYVLVNGTSGAYTVQFKYASGSGSSVTFAATDKGTKLVYATADHATNPNLVDTGIASTGDHDLDGNELILDADADTSITADTDDQIDIKIAGADDFQFTANTFTAQAGSTIAAQALTATTITASGIVKTDDTTEATSTTDGSLQTDGGLSVAKDAVLGDDLKLLSDSAVLSFGADSDTTLTHTDGTGLTLNSTNKLCLRDSALSISSSTDGQLDIDADTEVEIATTTLDLNGALDVSGASQFSSTITVGVDDTGYDVKFFGATSGAYMLWDESTDDLILAGAAKLYLYDAGGGEYLSSSGSALTIASGGTAWELPTSDGSANQLLKTDGSGNLDWTTVSGTITALNTQAANRITTIGSTTTELDGEANLTFTGSALTCIGTVTVGVDDTGHDVKFFGATSGAYMLWDESTDDLVLAGAAKLYLYDAAGGEHISSDGTDLTLAAGADLNLTATTDINVPANVGVTFGNDGEKIEGDGTDLTISGNNINLTATADVVIPANVGITFGTGEKIEGDSTDLTVTSGGAINLTATTDVVIPNNVGIQFGGASEKIEGDGTDLTISANNLTVDAAADIILDAAGNNVTFKSGGTSILDISNSSSDAVITSSVQDKDIIFKGDDNGSAITALTLDMSEAGAATFNNKVVATELDISGNMDIDGTSNLDAVDIDGAVQLDATFTVGADDQGYDVKLFGDTASAYMLWDTSADDLILAGGAGLIVPDGQFTLGSTAVSATAAELNLLDGGTSVGSSITLADADGIVVNDGGTMKTIPASDIKTYNPGGTSWQAVITGNTTAVAGRGYFANTTSSAFTLTLPSSPSIGDEVSFIDYAGTFDSNNLTIARNSEKIHGASEDLTVATERAANTLVYTDGTQGWLLKNK